MKIHDKIAHCCLVDEGSGPHVIPKIIMEEIGLQCIDDTPRKIVFNNSLQNPFIHIRRWCNHNFICHMTFLYPSLNTFNYRRFSYCDQANQIE